MDPGDGRGVRDDVVGDWKAWHAGTSDGEGIELVERRDGVAQKQLVFVAYVVV